MLRRREPPHELRSSTKIAVATRSFHSRSFKCA